MAEAKVFLVAYYCNEIKTFRGIVVSFHAYAVAVVFFRVVGDVFFVHGFIVFVFNQIPISPAVGADPCVCPPSCLVCIWQGGHMGPPLRRVRDVFYLVSENFMLRPKSCVVVG